MTIFPELDLLGSIKAFVEKEDGKSIEQYCDERLDELAATLIETECPAESEEITAQSKHHTASRRKVLRQQQAMKVLQQEEEEETKKNKDGMNMSEVQEVARNGINGLKRERNQSQRQQNRNGNWGVFQHRQHENVILIFSMITILEPKSVSLGFFILIRRTF